MSAYSHLQRTVRTNYNQPSMVRTIEQILGIPPMNVMDATAMPMFGCFNQTKNSSPYVSVKNNIPLDEMNKSAASLTGKAREYALLSSKPEFDHIDSGNDDLLNRILWFAAKGNQPYPKKMTIPKKIERMMTTKEKTWQKNPVSFFLKGKQFLHLVVLPALLLMFCKKYFYQQKQ
jgi:hypothetical protein